MTEPPLPAPRRAQRGSVRVFRMAKWYRILSVFAMLAIGGAGTFYLRGDGEWWQRLGGAALIAFGVAGFLDVQVSRIILGDDTIQLISLIRKRTFPRADLESAKVEGGAVWLQKRAGGWLKLPDTGANALSVRNSVDAWIKKQGPGIGDRGEKQKPED